MKIKYFGWDKIELVPIEVAKLTYGKVKRMSWQEFKARNEVASNFIKYLGIKIKKK